MNSVSTFRNILIASSFAGALASGCVITTGSVDCEVCNDSPLCHNHVGSDGECYCDADYQWEDALDPGNLECERIPSKPGTNNCIEPNSEVIGTECYCVSGYTWCDPNSATDLTCCVDPSQDAAGSSDTDSATGGVTSATATEGDTDSGTDTVDTTDTTDTGPQNEPPPDTDCTETGLRACSNTDAENVQGSTAWTCTVPDGEATGMWEELDLTPECEFEGSDFGYGCYDDGAGVIIECGSGPGTDCDDSADACSDTDLLQVCVWGKLTDVSCNTVCTTEGEVTFEFGECISGEARCQCCDSPTAENTCDCGGESTCE